MQLSPLDVAHRAALHAALGEPLRLAIVDDLAVSDRSPGELGERHGLSANLLAHHLDVLEAAGAIIRFESAGDRRRRYVRLITASFEWPVTSTMRSFSNRTPMRSANRPGWQRDGRRLLQRARAVGDPGGREHRHGQRGHRARRLVGGGGDALLGLEEPVLLAEPWVKSSCVEATRVPRPTMMPDGVASGVPLAYS